MKCEEHPEQLCSLGYCMKCKYLKRIAKIELTEQNYKSITDDEIKEWCEGAFTDYTFERLKEIITGEYDLKEARLDILSFRKEKK